MDQIKFGVHLPAMGFDGQVPTKEQMISLAQHVEALGYDSLSVNDHIVFHTSWLDAVSTLSAIAACTSSIKLGTSVLNIVVRNPVICAKALAAIDILSSGRLFAGIGPGSHRGDYEACGIPFEERWPRFSEALEILISLLDNNNPQPINPITGRGQEINPLGIVVELLEAAFIGLTASIIVRESRLKEIGGKKDKKLTPRQHNPP